MFLLKYIFLGFLLSGALSFKFYQEQIPNGGRIPHPCLSNHFWKGVGHQNNQGGGVRNLFGKDFANNGHKWDATLCMKDSDGDGRSNGEEVGDPDCVWTVGAAPTNLFGLSHPGICEPLDAPHCQKVNTWDFCTKDEFSCSYLNTDDVKNFTLRFTETEVPATETNYYCQVFDIPHDVAYHMIASQPVLDNENVIHHMTLFGCNDDPDNLLETFVTPQPCGMQGSGLCSTGLVGWTVGYVGSCPNNTVTGIRFGASSFKKAMLQVHWNNPLKVTDYTDSSGLLLYYTPKLRKYDLSTLVVGNVFFRIPSGGKTHRKVAGCTSECTSKNLNQPIKFTGSMLHMHLLGVAGELNHYRNGKLITTLASEPNYSYDNPITHEYSPEVEFLPGDELNLTCTYKSTGMASATYYGAGTQEEMCFAFLAYYPPSDLIRCSDVGSINFCTGNKDVPQKVTNIQGCELGAENNTEQNTAFETLGDVCDESGEICRADCYDHLTVDPHPCMKGDVKKLLEGFLPVVIGSAGMDIKMRMRSCDEHIYDGVPLISLNQAQGFTPMFWIQALTIALAKVMF